MSVSPSGLITLLSTAVPSSSPLGRGCSTATFPEGSTHDHVNCSGMSQFPLACVGRCPARSCGPFWMTCLEQLKCFGQNPQHLKTLEGSCEIPRGDPACTGPGSDAARPAAGKRNPRARQLRAISLATQKWRLEEKTTSHSSSMKSLILCLLDSRERCHSSLLQSHRICVSLTH